MALHCIQYYKNEAFLQYISDIEHITYTSSNHALAIHGFKGKIYINKK